MNYFFKKMEFLALCKFYYPDKVFYIDQYEQSGTLNVKISEFNKKKLKQLFLIRIEDHKDTIVQISDDLKDVFQTTAEESSLLEHGRLREQMIIVLKSLEPRFTENSYGCCFFSPKWFVAISTIDKKQFIEYFQGTEIMGELLNIIYQYLDYN